MQKKEKLFTFLEKLYESLSSDIKPLKITGYTTREPVPFKDRLIGKKSEIKVGKAWSKKLFDCAWMLFECDISGVSERPLALRLDVNGEMLVVDKNGNAAQGLTCKISKFCDALGKPAKCIYPLSEEMLKQKKVSVWADCALNDLFGRLKGGGKIASASLVRINSRIRELYYLYEHAYDWLFALDKKSTAQAKSLEKVLLETASLFGKNFEELSENSPQISVAKKILESVLFKKCARPNLKVWAIGHAHMDLAWLWPIRETKRKLARTFSTVLALQNRYPSYIYGASQPQAYLWMKENYPNLYLRLKDAIARGKIEPLGTSWVEPDCNLPSGESFIRQLIFGKKFFRDEFGTEQKYFWIPDSFGYSPQLPQILLKSGVEYFITQKMSWNTVNKFPHHSFWWQGLDSSKVLAHMLPEETYNSPAAPRSLIKINSQYAQKDVSDNALMAFGIGDGGGGPGEEHVERILKNKKVCALNEIKNRPVCEFLNTLKKEAKNFPTWRGDLYLERHQGTFTTQGLNKKYNRECEMLLGQAEWFKYVLEMLSQKKQNADDLREIWQEVLLYQFHDILPGSSIERVYKESCARYKILVSQLEKIIEKTLSEISKYLGGNIAFNTTSWNAQKNFGSLQLNIKKLGFEPLKNAKNFAKAAFKKNVLENEFLRVKFNSKGEITSLFDKKSETEFAKKSSPMNQFIVFDDFGDAWDFGNDYRKNKSRKMKLCASKFYAKNNVAVAEFEYECENSKVLEKVALDGNSQNLRLTIKSDWRTRRRMLRLRFPLNFDAQKAVSEVAFGSYEREPNDATKWRKARLETPAHTWVAMLSQKKSFALLNDAKYGYRLKDNAVEAGLLRCVPRPGEPLVSVADKESDVNDKTRDFADIGKQEYSFELMPISSKFDRAEVSARAHKFNSKWRILRGKNPQKFDEGFSFLEISNPKIELVAMKPSEDKTGWIARFVNLDNSSQNAKIDFKFVPQKIEETNLSEIPFCKNGKLDYVKFTPFEIKTFKLSYNI